MGIFKKSGEERETMSGEYLVVPYAKQVEAVTRVLSDAGMHIVYACLSDDTRRESMVYSIPCGTVLSCTMVKRHGGWKEN